MKPKRTVPASRFLLFILRFIALKHAARELHMLSNTIERSTAERTRRTP